jgi:TonB-linked SusC/RagA family outer membrane protein
VSGKQIIVFSNQLFTLIQMYKILIAIKCRRLSCTLSKLFLIMRLSVFLLLISILQVSAASTAAQTISLNTSNASLTSTLKEIQKQSGFNIIYDAQMIKKAVSVNVHLNNASLNNTLEQCFKGQPFTYVINNNTIIITPQKQEEKPVLAITVKGVVKDSKGQPIPGVSVKIKGTAIGTQTTADGSYTITVNNSNDVLTFSFIGFLTQEIAIGDKTRIDIVLVDQDSKLSEVVVVGYGTQKKANLTGAVSTVGAAQLENRPVTGVTNALAGTVPGLTIVSNSGQPGKDAGTISLRGQSLNATNALVVIDGVISGTNELNNINPNDIDNVSVLKDAASASIYGNRASGGVLVITTKKGKKGTAVITYSNSFGKNKAVALPDYLPSWQAATMYDQARVNEGQSAVYTDAEIQKFKDGSDPFNYPNTDWLGLFYNGNGFQQNHYLGVSGGSDKTTYALSIGYFDQNGITKNTNTQRYTTRLNLNTKLKDNLSVFGYFSYDYQPLTEPQSSRAGTPGFPQVIFQFNRISPIIPAYFKNGDYGSISDGSPLAWINSPSFDKQNYYNFQGSVGADWEIIKGLHFKPSLNYKLNTNQNSTFIASIQYYNPDGSTLGQANVNNSTQYYSSFTYVSPQALLEYGTQIGNHSIKVLAGASQEYSHNYNLTGYRQNFVNNSLSTLDAAPPADQSTANSAYDAAQRSFFGRINYDYKGKYLLEGDIRDDGSSRFAPANRWGIFPGGSVGWRISEEDFFSKLKSVIPNLKLRASWGKLGNQDITGYYPAIATVSSGQNYPFGGTIVGGLAPTAGVYPNIVWEKSTQTDIGLDADFLNVFSFTADYFYKKTSDALYQVTLPQTYGLTAPFVNGSTYRNAGWELALSYHDRAGDFRWNVTGNASLITNKVLQLGTTNAPQINGGIINQVGQPQGSFYGYVSEGLFQTQAQVAAHASQTAINPNTGPGDIMYKDLNGDGKIDASDRTVLGSNFPKVTFGLSLNLNWKEFDLSAFFQGAANVKNYIQSVALGQNGIAVGKPTSAMLDSWTPNNTNATFPRLWLNYTQNDPSSTVSSFWVRNASYLRLKNAQLGYTLPAAWAKSIGISKLRVYYSGQNLFTFTNFYKWIDPEAPLSADGSGYPQVKINSLGLNVTF